MFYSLFSEFGFFIIQIHFGYKGLWGRIYSCIFGRKNMFLEGKNPQKNPRSSYSFGKGKSQIKICICWCPLATIWHWSLMTKKRVLIWRWISLLKRFPFLVVNEWLKHNYWKWTILIQFRICFFRFHILMLKCNTNNKICSIKVSSAMIKIAFKLRSAKYIHFL